jgi:hypothetical protein
MDNPFLEISAGNNRQSGSNSTCVIVRVTVHHGRMCGVCALVTAGVLGLLQRKYEAAEPDSIVVLL